MIVNTQPVDRDEARNMNAVVLSYVGDAVHTLFIRERLTRHSGARAHVLHERSVGLVNAAAQARQIEAVEAILTEEERGVFLRGRNCKNTSSSKNANIVDYRKATGFEALIGFLFLCGDGERLGELLEKSMTASDAK